MSNAGQAALTIVGTVVGGYFGYPQLGYLVGSLAGQALFPTQLPAAQGPRLGDGQQTVVAVGAPIPWIHGTQTVGGIIVWASPIREVATTQTVGGKGGPEQEQTTYDYYRSFAILLCEGPIGGVRRVWANGKIVYDRSLPGGVPLEDLLQDVDFFNATVVSEAWAKKMTVYLGTEDQMPDPVIESFEGVGNVPAYRGYALLVFDDVKLKPEDGYRIPASWKIEVFESGDEYSGSIYRYSNEVLYPWTQNPPNYDPTDRFDQNVYACEAVTYRGSNEKAYSSGPKSSLAAALVDWQSLWNADDTNALQVNAMHAIGLSGSSLSEFWPIASSKIPSESLTQAYVWYAQEVPSDYELVSPGDGTSTLNALLADGVTIQNPRFYLTGPAAVPQLAYVRAKDAPVTLATEQATNFQDNDNEVYVLNTLRVRIQRTPGPPMDPCDVGYRIADIPDYAVVGGQLLPCGPWEYVEDNFLVLQRFSQSSGNLITLPLGPVLPQGDSASTQQFWEAAYQREVARGNMADGLSYPTDYPKLQEFAYRKQVDASVIDVHPVSLATIVARICERVGLTQYDVADLEDKFVIGYQISRPMLARSAIEPLRSVGLFDVVESGIELAFVARGKAHVVALEEADLGAAFFEEEAPSKITTQKVQELELPRQVRVRYQNVERDYDPGEELSPPRFDTRAKSVVDIDLAVAITPTHAAQIAEVIHRDMWASRWLHNAQVDQSQSALQPADCVIAPVDGFTVRMRIVSLVDRLPNLRVLEMVRDDDGSYVSTAVGSSSQISSPQLAIVAPVESVFLDLPALSTEDDDAGFYVAARPLLSGGLWRGANVLRSVDNGNTYTLAATAGEPSAMGVLLSDVPAGPTTIFDHATSFVVELDYGEIESRSIEDVLNGANGAAIGDDGRWEVIQFTDAELIVNPNIYRVTGLLRGRRGTEHNVGSAESGDRFVLLSGGTVVRVRQSIPDIARSYLYRVAPAGMSSSVSSAIEFVARGVALKPFSPAYLQGQRDEGGNLTISWMPRDRLGTDTTTTLSEAVEDYELEILDSNGSAIRTISVSTPQAIYSDQQQITDFGALQQSVTVRVYQMSTVIGRGYPAQATL